MADKLSDVVVVLPGILGSVLSDSDGKPIWKADTATLLRGIITGGAEIKRLALPSDIGDGPAPDGVSATGLMPNIHLLWDLWTVSVGYDGLLNWFRQAFDTVEPDPEDSDRLVNFVPFAYDWRLSNRYNAEVLKATVDPILERYRAKSGNPDAKFIFVGHSMGGLVARYFVDVLSGSDRTRAVITLGTPHRGALNALAELVNGSRKAVGPVAIDLTAVARSLPSLHQLLPEYACVEGPDGSLKKITDLQIPQLRVNDLTDAMAFHKELRKGMEASAGRYDSYPILARTQPTFTTARIVDGKVMPLLSIEGRFEQGDGTVPRLSAAPYGIASKSPILHYVMAQHGHLPADVAVHTEIGGFLTGRPMIAKAVTAPIGVMMPDVLIAGEALDITAESLPDIVLQAEVTGLDGATGAFSMLTQLDHAPPEHPIADGVALYRARIEQLSPGAYCVTVSQAGGAEGDQVTKPIFVADPSSLIG